MASNNLNKKLEEEVKKSIVSYSFYRPESALIIALTMMFTALAAIPQMPFPGEWWMWLLFGIIGEALIILSTLRDEKFYQEVLEKMFKEQFDLKKLHSKVLQEKLAKAIEYRDLIIKEIEREEDPVLDDYLLDMAHGLEDWIAQLYHLAQGVDAYQRDPIIARDTKTVPQELQRLKAALRREDKEAVRRELEKTIATKESQWQTLKNLKETTDKAQLQIENTLSAMGTVYTQVILLGAKDVNSPRAQRLQADINEQVYALEDVSLAMDEVYHTNEERRMKNEE